jgi:hypothetical protein
MTPTELEPRPIRVAEGRTLLATPVFDSYWRFAARRQRLFMRRLAGASPPWTEDPILQSHRFTNAYRAADRVSQFLIREVLYKGSDEPDEVFFRTLLFKLFNKIETWKTFVTHVGFPTWEGFDLRAYDDVLNSALARGERIYSAAYIMPAPPFGFARKHRNHLELLKVMMSDGAPRRVAQAGSLNGVFNILRGYPSLGDFLAFQFTIDLNYSTIVNFSEMDFVVAGPGAKDGLRKCFVSTDGLTEAAVIENVTKMADREFERLELEFETLWGRPLHLIDCQNLFCEVDKYARVVHPEFVGLSGRTRIKQKFQPKTDPLPQFYPPKWGLSPSLSDTQARPSASSSRPSSQTHFGFDAPI